MVAAFKLFIFKHMKCRKIYFLIIAAVAAVPAQLKAQSVSDLKLKDYKPVSIYSIPQTKVEKAKYPVIDFHSHDYPETDAAVDAWVKVMDEKGIAKSIILSYATEIGRASCRERV